MSQEQDSLLFVQEGNVAEAVQEIKKLKGRVTHRFGKDAIVARMPSLPAAGLKYCAKEPPPLDLAARLAINAWRQNLELRATPRAPGPEEGVAWDAAPYKPPTNFEDDPSIGDAFIAPVEAEDEGGDDESGIQPSTGTPTSLYLVGSVAVGLVLVSRDSGDESMSEDEQTTVVQQTQQGLDFLANAEPQANVSFVYDIQPITVDVAPGPVDGVSGAYERYERPWRDAALAEMGYAAGREGYRQYVDSLRSDMETDWAFVAFFTKYAVNHFAYAIWEKVVMHYDNDGWGANNIHRVLAHEACHIFGAADEYGGCQCGSLHGHLQAPNNNCVNCFPPGAQVDCLMNQNTLTMCPFSRRQIGWDPSLFPDE